MAWNLERLSGEEEDGKGFLPQKGQLWAGFLRAEPPEEWGGGMLTSFHSSLYPKLPVGLGLAGH